MLYSIKDREFSEKLNQLVSLQNQVQEFRLQEKLGKQNFQEDMKKVFEPVTKSIENTSQDITRTITGNSNKNNQAIENLSNKLLEIMNSRGKLASYLMSPLSKNTYPENTSQFKLVKDHNSNRVNDLLTHNTIPVHFYNNLLNFRDTGRKIELKGDLLKMITNKNYNVDLASIQDKKLMYDFAKETNFYLKAEGEKSTRDRTLKKLPKSTGLMISASGILNTIFLGSEKYPDSAILINYDDDDDYYYSQGYGQVKEAFRALSEDDILEPYISQHDFRSSNDCNNIRENLYVFDIRYQKNFGSAQSVKVEFKFTGNVPEILNSYALVLTNKVISISSDGQTQFDLI